MKCRAILVLLLATLAATADLAAQDATTRTVPPPFSFRHGQTVYVTAFHTIEHFTSRGLNVVPPANIVDSHLPAELQVRKDFEKRKVYTLVNKASGADFVFLVLIHDNAAEGLALAPDVFKEYQNKINIEALREAAYARVTVGPLKIHNLGRISDHLVRQFHEEGGRPTKAPS